MILNAVSYQEFYMNSKKYNNKILSGKTNNTR